MNIKESLENLQVDIYQWLVKLELRSSGEDGIANLVIQLQSQVEENLNAIPSKEKMPLNKTDRKKMINLLNSWIEQIAPIINKLSVTAEREQHTIPLMVEAWATRLLEKMNNDTDSKLEGFLQTKSLDNIKFHTALVNCVVKVLLPTKDNDEINQAEVFASLNRDLTLYNSKLIQDAGDIQMVSDENKDLKEMLNELCESWIYVGNRLMQSELSTKKIELREEIPAPLFKGEYDFNE